MQLQTLNSYKKGVKFFHPNQDFQIKKYIGKHVYNSEINVVKHCPYSRQQTQIQHFPFYCYFQMLGAQKQY